MGDAISWSWNRFTQNAVTLVVPVLAYAVALAAVIGATAGLVVALGVGRIAWMFWRLAHRCPNRFVVRFYRYPRDAKQTGT
ncbi:hypothetical protein [Mycobacterium tuberculosis]|uniref:hypothetical protein n=1 Tax=Mycobacterium tuberculosis TaxID=1773 RepID=UPI00081F23BD|nr:hypothetical protein [Mycobacterium tuberculosis]SIP64888.1 hypothetical protein BN9982_1490002 [Mycobacterium tuberculosis]